jgi:hypothetical protein
MEFTQLIEAQRFRSALLQPAPSGAMRSGGIFDAFGLGQPTNRLAGVDFHSGERTHSPALR